MDSASASDCRVPTISWVIGCDYKPKQRRMPIDRVTAAAPPGRTWVIDSFGGEGMARNVARISTARAPRTGQV